MRDAVEIDDVRGKGAEGLFDGLGVADVGEEGGEDGQCCRCGGDRDAGLGHQGTERGGFEGDGLAAGVGAAQNELPCRTFELEGKRYDLTPTGAEALFEERMARRF